jgi:hypothetical protein
VYREKDRGLRTASLALLVTDPMRQNLAWQALIIERFPAEPAHSSSSAG